MLYTTPELDATDAAVLAGIYRRRDAMASAMRVPKRWPGLLRRNLMARAIRGSNSIEGYVVETDDAAAAVDYEEALTADERTFAEIRGYRQALGYVLTMAQGTAAIDESTIRALHFMMLGHDLGKSPGQYRTGPIYVRDDSTGDSVYEGPGSAMVPRLMAELAEALATDSDPIVLGAMAHLNLVMIHPFRDGNGRMARALQTLVVSRGGLAEPTFCSIEEWLGVNTHDYYQVLARSSSGVWSPENDARLWLKFNLRAHDIQAQTVEGRMHRTERAWLRLDELVSAHKLPERVTDILYDALIGFRIRRHGYLTRAQVDQRTATRDLKALTDLGLLTPRGETRGRHYIAGDRLLELQAALRMDVPRRIVDPYPELRVELVRG
ncbi:Fic family protein [Nocardia amikacinitolerans]|uniref:Fic family protein n=1 Tax=Nocardia amikacinitolerans TaxID=756689 RepID=UPI0020A5019E|nr:Fic family protein [Nocardia amikacinitolerans]MCP2292906.1 Fic family protein [Nocardia amikacinitolerans]